MSVVIGVLSAAVVALTFLAVGGCMYSRELEKRLEIAFDDVGLDVEWLADRVDDLESPQILPPLVVYAPPTDEAMQVSQGCSPLAGKVAIGTLNSGVGSFVTG